LNLKIKANGFEKIYRNITPSDAVQIVCEAVKNRSFKVLVENKLVIFKM